MTSTYTLEDCQKHTTEDSCWLVIEGKVYDVTQFLDEHPGGYDIIITNTGKDATEDFEEIGHSTAAKEMLDKYLIGAFEGPVAPPKVAHVPLHKTTAKSSSSSTGSLLKAILPIIVLLLAYLYTQYAKK